MTQFTRISAMIVLATFVAGAETTQAQVKSKSKPASNVRIRSKGNSGRALKNKRPATESQRSFGGIKRKPSGSTPMAKPPGTPFSPGNIIRKPSFRRPASPKDGRFVQPGQGLGNLRPQPKVHDFMDRSRMRPPFPQPQPRANDADARRRPAPRPLPRGGNDRVRPRPDLSGLTPRPLAPRPLAPRVELDLDNIRPLPRPLPLPRADAGNNRPEPDAEVPGGPLPRLPRPRPDFGRLPLPQPQPENRDDDQPRQDGENDDEIDNEAGPDPEDQDPNPGNDPAAPDADPNPPVDDDQHDDDDVNDQPEADHDHEDDHHHDNGDIRPFGPSGAPWWWQPGRRERFLHHWCFERPVHCHWWFDYCLPLADCDFAEIDTCSWHHVICDLVLPGGQVFHDAEWYLGLEGIVLPHSGLGIDLVEDDSPAALAGLQPGMVILSCNEIRLTGEESVGEAIAASGGLLELIIQLEDGTLAETYVEMIRVSAIAL